ncbi:hypothetical protein Adt_01611 [Abeliophyllum distichum]|uniref:Uncharacterized protein n=1 Tax=Abeliophyllum distichum TaxID=126358 RepID=A0ABD1VVQ6_9LAMI
MGVKKSRKAGGSKVGTGFIKFSKYPRLQIKIPAKPLIVWKIRDHIWIHGDEANKDHRRVRRVESPTMAREARENPAGSTFSRRVEARVSSSPSVVCGRILLSLRRTTW